MIERITLNAAQINWYIRCSTPIVLKFGVWMHYWLAEVVELLNLYAGVAGTLRSRN